MNRLQQKKSGQHLMLFKTLIQIPIELLREKVESLNQIFSICFFLKKPVQIIPVEAVQLEFKLLNLNSTWRKFWDILGICAGRKSGKIK